MAAVVSIIVATQVDKRDYGRRVAQAVKEQQRLQAEFDAAHDRQRQLATEEAHKAAMAEAKKRTAEVAATYAQILSLNHTISQDVTDADRHLALAADEFAANAFGPFWDAIEAAALDFAKTNTHLTEMRQSITRYLSLLARRHHNFPIPPLNSRSIPDLTLRLEMLRTLVRSGQTNYSFASIWEHRQTRKVLVSGFATLADCLSEISETLQYSIDAVVTSIKRVEMEVTASGRDISSHVSSLEAIEQQRLDIERERRR